MILLYFFSDLTLLPENLVTGHHELSRSYRFRIESLCYQFLCELALPSDKEYKFSLASKVRIYLLECLDQKTFSGYRVNAFEQAAE